MKRFIQLLALVSVIGGLAMLTGCQKENWGRKGSAKEVRFGATVNPTPFTRTQYMEYNGTDANQKIKWLNSDKIRIFSDNAARRGGVDGGQESNSNPYYYWADYQLTDINASSPWIGKLANLSNDGGYSQEQVGNIENNLGNGLVWINENPATFYALYPMPESGDPGTGKNNIFPNGVFETPYLLIPSTQEYSPSGNMGYAYMTAFTGAVNPGADVSLTFYPDFTAFEISLKCADAEAGTKLNSFTIGSTGTSAPNLAGNFYVRHDGNKAYRYINDTQASKTITVSMGSGGVSVPSGDADPLTFTVFALPQDLSPLYLQFVTTSNVGDKTWKLNLTKNGSAINFGACKKHRIFGLELPNNEWLITYSEDGMTVEEWVVNDDNNQTLIVE